MAKEEKVMEKIVSLTKRRGFVFPDSEIYGGLANTWDFGPLGIELKRNIKQAWWERFVRRRDDIVGVDTALIMNPCVWEASGHLKKFSDPMVECLKCHRRFRVDKFSSSECPECGSEKGFTKPRAFNLLFKTFIGTVEDEKATAYLRGETAQGMFVNFRNILDTTRKTIPFGIAQIGKAFRNEVTPGNFIFRTREFEQMEIEYFIKGGDWGKYFDMWHEEMMQWMRDMGLDMGKIHSVEIPEEERAHYSKRTIDFEFEFPFGQKELYGLAYRGDFDLKNHEKHSGKNLKYRDQANGEEFWPHVIEPTWGVERTILAILISAYDDSDQERVVLKLKPNLAPYKAAVFPLLANKPELVEFAKKIYDDLRKEFAVAWDDRGNIGKRYYSQDEIGTPFCITVDFESLEKNDVTVRDRDSAKQERIGVVSLKQYISGRLSEE